jgi:conserved oligomeric Golgi complex subunit 6
MEGRVKENIVDSRIKKVLSNRYDNSLILESLDTINDYILSHGNTISTRKTLRNDIELQNISINKAFLLEYSKVFSSIQSLHSQCQEIEEECGKMSSKVNKANENIKLFLEKATELEERGSHVMKQKENIEFFLDKFQLTQMEIDELYSLSFNSTANSAPAILTENFFKILKKLRVAYQDCKEMVELYQYSAGYELLDLLSHHQDIGYQKLFEWVKLRCDTSTSGSSSFSNGDPAADDLMLQTALSYLREIPSYFLQCQELVISSRRTLIVQRFVLAVTQGQQQQASSSVSGSGERGAGHSSSRGFEMHSYDPVRFVGDMLAWTHQAIASEEEFLRAIFGTSLPLSTQLPASTSASEGPVGEREREGEEEPRKELSNSIPELLVRCLSGLGRPLKVRILQTLENLRSSSASASSSSSSSSSHGHSSLATLYLLCDLILFYSQTYARILPLENSIGSAVEECFTETKRSFQSSLGKQIELLHSQQLHHSSVNLFAMDTLSTVTTREYCQLLTELLDIYHSSMALAHQQQHQGEGKGEEGEGEVISLSHILESLLHPLLQSCRTSATTAFGENNFDMAIFMINNVSLLKVSFPSMLLPFLTCIISISPLPLLPLSLLSPLGHSPAGLLFELLLCEFCVLCDVSLDHSSGDRAALLD